MQFRKLGNSGLQVPILSLGGNVFGQHTTFSHYLNQKETVKLIDRALELEANLIDTADMYSRGVSETYISKAIVNRRNRFIIASKVGMSMRDNSTDVDLSRKHILNGIEDTLRRLKTDYVDLYYAHQFDPSTPLEETLRTFEELILQGKVRYVGCSNFSAGQIENACEVSRKCGYNPIVVSQSPYNLIDRSVETEIAPCCSSYGLSMMPYSPLAQGVLTGKYRRGEKIPPNTRAWNNPSKVLAPYMSDDNLAMVETLDVWAKKRDHCVGELAIAWLLSKPFVCSVITAVTSIEQLEANVQAIEWKLDAKELEELEGILNSPQ